MRPGTFGLLKVTAVTHREQSMSVSNSRVEEIIYRRENKIPHVTHCSGRASPPEELWVILTLYLNFNSNKNRLLSKKDV